MSEAQAVPDEKQVVDHRAPGADHWIVAILFLAASLTFVLHFTGPYTKWQNGHWYDVAFGLWGLYWGVFLAWGVLRARPRKGRTGLFHSVLWLGGAQGFFLAMAWGDAWLSDPDKATAYIGWAGVVAFCASPVLGILLALTARRWVVFLLAQVLGPAIFFGLHFLGK